MGESIIRRKVNKSITVLLNIHTQNKLGAEGDCPNKNPVASSQFLDLSQLSDPDPLIHIYPYYLKKYRLGTPH